MLDAWMPNFYTKQWEKTYNSTAVQESIESSCIGKQTCTIDARSFVDPKNEPKICTDNLAQFYTQVFWKFDNEELERRNLINKVLVGEWVLIILILLAYFHFAHHDLKEKYNEWDQKTTTIEDYTLKWQIPQKLYDDFVLNIYRQDSNENPVYAFKKYLNNEISTFINKDRQDASDAATELKIVDIEFTFSNILLLELMHKRAKAIEEHDKNKRLKIEKEITEEYSSMYFSLLFLEDYLIPKVAFIIFESEEAFQNALKLGINRCCWFTTCVEKINGRFILYNSNDFDLGVGIYMESAEQPTNTEWQNCHKSICEKILRILGAVVILGIVIIIGFFLLYVTEFNKETMHEKISNCWLWHCFDWSWRFWDNEAICIFRMVQYL